MSADFINATPFTQADLDEWIANTAASDTSATFTPYEWARAGLSALLGGRDIPRLLTRDELLTLLREARGGAR